MKNVASKPWTLAALVATTLACLAAFALLSAPAVEAEQSRAGDAEIAARVRAELEARLAQVNQRLLEHMREFELMREVDLEKLLEGLEVLSVDEGRIRELVARSVESAAALHRQSFEVTRHRSNEIAHRAMEQAEQALHRAGLVSVLRWRGSCNAFGDTVLGFSEELGLSEDQEAEIREAQRAAQRDRIERKADIEIGEMDLEALYETDQPDLAAIRAKLEELAVLGVDDQMAGLSLGQRVRGVLTPLQLEQLDDVRSDDDIHIIINGVGSSWSGGGFGC